MRGEGTGSRTPHPWSDMRTRVSGRVTWRNTDDALGNARDSIKLVTGEAGFNDLSVVMQQA